MMDKLLPCPFCGGEATISDGGYSGEKFLARCRELSCPASSGFIRKTHDEAVAAWNRRAQPENKPTADAVPVVRCGECSHYNISGCSEGFGWCEKIDRGVTDGHFCSYGEKMEDKS